MQLPKPFLDKMSSLLGDEYDAFVSEYSKPSHTALRLNTLKPNNINLNKLFNLTPVPWCSTGYYYLNSTPGKHPYHNAGLYYIQEPSAMAVVELADIKPNQVVLDLCAAPGGKSTHIACKLNGTGLLVANEIVPNRAKSLSENIERFGITNCVVINESPNNLADKLGNIFDAVFVDAPCSGEGMFRKDEIAIREWSVEHSNSCHTRQMEILNSADKLVKTGGKLVYSTCTFAVEENENTINQFLKTHTNYTVQKINHCFDNGIVIDNNFELSKCVRIYPHHVQGEGHFIAVLTKLDDMENQIVLGKPNASNKQIAIFNKWQKDNLNNILSGKIYAFADNLYLAPDINIDISKLKVLRYGLHLGEVKKDIFIPNHSLSLALKLNDFKNVVNVNLQDAISYLRGNILNANCPNGWCVITLDGCVLGFGKVTDGQIKNHYPKGLRI